MTLRLKTLIIVGLTLIALITAMYLISSRIILDQAYIIEKQKSIDEVKRARDSLEDTISKIDTSVVDWANWDDTCVFMKDHNKAYMDSNLTLTLKNINIEVIAFISLSGEILEARGLNLEAVKFVPPSKSFLEKIYAGSPLINHPDIKRGIKAIVLLPEGPLMIASRPVLNSEGEPPVRGTLIMGRYLDDNEIKTLCNITHLSIKFYRLDSQDLPSEYRGLAGDKDKIFIKPLNDEKISGYTVIRDVYDKPALVMEIESTRDIYKQGLASIHHFLIIILILGIIFLIVTILILETMVLSPVSRLSKSVINIGEKGQVSERVPITGKDELAKLGQQINIMLAGLEQAEVKLKKAKEAAEIANRAKSEFLANMSHEIRTPMNAIMGMTDMTLDTSLTREQKDYLQTVKQSAESLMFLLNSILDLSKLEAGKMELESIDFDLPMTLEFIVNTLAVQAQKKGVELLLHIKSDIPKKFKGDPARLRQIIINLIGNAIKFTEKGEILLRVEKEDKKNDEKYSMLHFSISDTGIGIRKEKLETIFESFTQADGSTTRKYGGTGLGLTISKQLVKLMKGDIWVESEPGKGSTFHFICHLEPVDTDKVEQLPLPDLKGLDVIIVDDNATNRLIVRDMVTKWGFKAVEAASGEKALATMWMAKAEGNPFRIALLDYQMPVMDGFELAKKIKSNNELSDTHLIVLTSAGQKEDLDYCREIGIEGYLTKPVIRSVLLDKILAVLGRPPGKTSASKDKDYMIRKTTKSLHILLAEDVLTNQKLATSLLIKRGHSVVIANNGAEALEAFKKEKFDLILMDIQMPVMDGIEATALIRNSGSPDSQIPIIAMTAHAMKGDRERFISAGMNDYIEKPLNIKEAFGVIEKFSSSSEENKERQVQEMPYPDNKPVKDNEPAVNKEAALAAIGNDKELLEELYEIFIQEAPSILKGIKEGLDSKNSGLIKLHAHSLKSSSAHIGANLLKEVSYEMELAGKNEDLTKVAEIYKKLEHELERVVQTLMKRDSADN